MPDHPTKQLTRDPYRIDIHAHGEVGYWCERLNCTRAQLIIGVHSVGPMVAAVAGFLRETTRPMKRPAMAVQNSSPLAAPNLPRPANGKRA